MSRLLARLACIVLNQKVNVWVMVLIQQRQVRGAASMLPHHCHPLSTSLAEDAVGLMYHAEACM